MNQNQKAALLSGLVYPGLGQIKKKQTAKGIVIVVLITFDVLWLFERIMVLVWNTGTATGPDGMPTVKMDPATFALLHHQAWVQNWWLVVIFAVIWIYSIVDAAVSQAGA
jgi:hypothetical protein